MDLIAVYETVHNSPEINTVANFIAEPGSLASYYIKDMDSFLSVVQSDGVTTNRQAIEAKFNGEYAKKENKFYGRPASTLPLLIGTKLAIPLVNINREGFLSQGIEVVSNNIPAFKAKALALLENDPGYKPTKTYNPIKGKIQKGIVKEMHPHVSVWVWCRALSSGDFSSESQGEIFNLSPFVSKVSTNVGKDGGNFQITLPPLVCEWGEGKWKVKKENIKAFLSQTSSIIKQSYVAEGSMYNVAPDGELERNQFLFHNIISSNDLVWIRYETLDVEGESRAEDDLDFIVNKNSIPGKIYDMIGLVDVNSQATTPASTDVTINISGRDLSKLLIEDGSYFYPLEMSQGQVRLAGGSTQQNSLTQRLISDNSLQYFNLYYNNSIKNVFEFVIQQLSTIKVIPNNLLETYGNRRNTKVRLEGGVEEKRFFDKRENLDDLLKKAKESIRDIRKEAALTLSLNEDKKIDELWSELHSFMLAVRNSQVRKTSNSKTIGWRKFRYKNEEILEDTLPSLFHREMQVVLCPEKTSFHKRGEKELLPLIDQYIDQKIPDSPTSIIDKPAEGIWQIIKLVIDEGVSKRRIVDSSMSSANGSLINYIRKVCQEPFVEFYSDTYGDMFYFIVRKPPYDEEGITSMLEGHCSTEDGKVVSAIIDIEAHDVISENLQYDDQSAITWYHLSPQSNFIGNASTYSLSYLPAIFLKEYADIWGSRSMDLVHNYLPYVPYQSSKQGEFDITEEQAFSDLKYMVESTAYLPFTRKGTITVNGDRRVKFGNIIRYKATGEIFFVKHVKQDYSIGDKEIDRYTTIEVERGMIEKYVSSSNNASDQAMLKTITSDSEVEFKKVGYFDIVNTSLNKEQQLIKETVTETTQVGTKKVETPENSSVESLLYDTAQQFKGYKYAYGADGKGGVIDCSGFVSAVLRRAGISVQARTSEEIMIKSNDFQPVDFYNISTLQAGDVIGVDTKGDNRKYGIDHIAIVVKNINNGQLELAESVRGKGVISQPLNKALNYYNSKKVRKRYLGNFRYNSTKPPTVEEQPIYKTETFEIQKKYVDRAKIFDNFQVNKAVFNFFVRRIMNSKKSHKDGK
jgi:cell wall-associated NlpC family hydrolase